MSKDELVENAAVLIIAGSETTAALLCGATYLLAKNPHALERLAQEVRNGFGSEDEIDLVSTQRLKYMQAVLDESLRYFPPAVGSMPRKIAPGGDYILDRYIPENVSPLPFYRVARRMMTNTDHYVRWWGKTDCG